MFKLIVALATAVVSLLSTTPVNQCNPFYFQWPTEFPGELNQDFWEHPELYPVSGGHTGIDMKARDGTIIISATDGSIYANEWDDEYGWRVVVETWVQEQQYFIVYGHLREKSIWAEGVSLQRGDFIGYAGSTGNSTGPHLHFEVVKIGAFQNNETPCMTDCVDPKLYFVELCEK